MRNSARQPKRAPFVRLLLAAALLLPAALAPAQAAAQKMTAEEVVTRHLDSLGTAEDRAAVKSRLMQGVVSLVLRSPGAGRGQGASIMFSEGDKSAIAMNFGSPDYPFDKFGFDGNKLTVSYLRPGARSQLGDFIFNRDVVFKQGLMGGVLSSAWPLLTPGHKNAKLEYAGSEKLNDRQAHKLRYAPRRGSDLKITLYFDAENFRHLRTEYEQTVSNQMGASAEVASRQLERARNYRLVEDFSDFKQEGRLTLPHTYKIYLSLDRRIGGNYIAEWEMKFDKFGFNQQLDPQWFDVSASE
ncbi:MAG TPA: hypothetical protein VEQ42_11980 [Pyrinomonadaceae bacterium]|nr:hypothetical protein [Pyrinomonadaceae bacterium]